MAKRTESRTFNISVIGLSGTEKEKGLTGVGKSCLCNRFMRPLANDYHGEHISVLSQSDFGGRVINNDHFLYWGDICKTDEGVDHTFHVIEQTEFTDDVSFQPFKTGKYEPYSKRCISTKVQSAEKLMYICKEQLGMETDSAYEQKLMPDGKLNIDGFMVLFDVSSVHNRPIERQVEFVSNILQSLQKIRKPVVLATTKHDEAVERFCKEAVALVTRSKVNIPIVETSALENINVELAFMTLAHLIDGTKVRKKIIPFADAYRARKDVLEVATKAYKKLLNTQVTDPKALWTTWKKKFMKESDYIHYVDLFGTEQAMEHFRKHTKQLREEQLRRRELHYLDSLPSVLQHFFPSLDVISDKSWISCQNYIYRHPDMPKFFVNIGGDGQSWRDGDWLDNDDKRLPFDLLKSSEAETTFKNHVNALQEQHKKFELKRKFKDFLEENKQVKPGKPISETYICFVGKECYNGLNERERDEVYEQHQADLRQRAKLDFQELMWEKSEVFTELNPSVRLTQDDLKIITNALQNDSRYQLLDRLEEDRKVMILNHLGFIQCPSKERCYFRENCVEAMAQKILAYKPTRPDASESSQAQNGAEQPFNLVLLGKDGLASEVNLEIRDLCVEDEYSCQNIMFSLDYRPIDGDVSQEQHAFVTPTFKPHGCVCVYNSVHTFEYVRYSLEQTWLSDLACEDGQVLDRLRFVIIQIHNSMISDREVEQLREQGWQLATKLQCKFYYIPHELDASERRKISQVQIEKALQSIIRPVASGLLSSWHCSDFLEADLKIAVCMMCGDKFSIEFSLAPLLNQDFFRVINEENGQWMIEVFLDDMRVRVEIILTSYHGANLMKDELFHGYLLIYSAQRRASLSTMRAFASHLRHQLPILVLAITDSTSTADEHVKTLISEGNAVADILKAHFMTTPPHFQHQHSIFNPFFKDAWERREDTESFFHHVSEPPSNILFELNPTIEKRPPAPLPKPNDLYHTTKSSTINRCISPDWGCQSTEESEPLYDHLVFPNQYHSDSEHERVSSPSPPPVSSLTDYEIISSVAAQTNGEHLIKPSQVKSRRNKCVGLLEFPVYDSPTCQADDTVWAENNLYKSTKGSTKASGNRLEPGPLNRKQYEPVAKVITRNITNARNMPTSGRLQAPLAVPEPIEIADYEFVSLFVFLDFSFSFFLHSFFLHSFPTLSFLFFFLYYFFFSLFLIHYFKLLFPYIFQLSLHSFQVSPFLSSFIFIILLFQHLPSFPFFYFSALISYCLSLCSLLVSPVKGFFSLFSLMQDAVPQSPPESDYALVEDALPAGKVHRIKSTRKKEHKVFGTTDSEDSEFSSLERDRMSSFGYRVNRHPTPYKMHHTQRYDDIYMTLEPDERHLQGYFYHRADLLSCWFGCTTNTAVLTAADAVSHPLSPSTNIFSSILSIAFLHYTLFRSQSPSEGSEGTGDELLLRRKPRSFKKKCRSSPTMESSTCTISPPLSDSDNLNVFSTLTLFLYKHTHTFLYYSPSYLTLYHSLSFPLIPPLYHSISFPLIPPLYHSLSFPLIPPLYHSISFSLTLTLYYYFHSLSLSLFMLLLLLHDIYLGWNLKCLDFLGDFFSYLSQFFGGTISPRVEYSSSTLSKYGTLVDEYGDLTDSGNWKDMFNVKIRHKDSTTDRAKKKEEKRRQKEEEKKLKEQQKLQKKIKKKDGKVSSASQSGSVLEDYTMSPRYPRVPLFVEKCVQFIEEEGLTAEGIYRVPGNRAQVELLLTKFQEDPSVDIQSLDIQVNAVATALKGFFNDLMEALLPSTLINELTEASGFPDKSSRLLALRGVLKKLPLTNYEVLKYLITHFNRIGRHYDTNNMDSKNLARCWWPTLIRMDFQSYGELTYNSRIPLEILQTLIEQSGFFFHGENQV
ncbi:ARHGAP5 [Acanthosepion pharaonis]|uniref:ARHGAP5 n=1 Tax=Acanthosepion pharaonis TaxID=158019 RepID=A0A812AU96_ACAPH|nr:ARHGAP5 [Sepia pharaonis]